jgi:hypothetical protein
MDIYHCPTCGFSRPLLWSSFTILPQKTIDNSLDSGIIASIKEVSLRNSSLRPT